MTVKKCTKKRDARAKLLFYQSKGLFTWGGGPRSSGVDLFCFHALEDTKQKKPTPLDRGPPLHVNRVETYCFFAVLDDVAIVVT